MAIELLIHRGPDDEPRKLHLEEDVVTIGRDPTSSVLFDMASDLDVSTRHAEIRLQDGRYAIEDLDSTNGTWVNGKLVRWPHPLNVGDMISLGRKGPKLRVVSINENVWHKTKVTPVRPAPVHPHPDFAPHRTEERLAGIVESRTRWLRLGIVGAFAAISLLLAGGGWLYLRTRPTDDPRVWREVTAPGILKANEEAVALIETRIPGTECSGGCEGTGFAITTDGLLVTNRHVVMQDGVRAKTIRVKFANTGKWTDATLVRVTADTSVDLALIRAQGSVPYKAVVSVSEKGADLPIASDVMTIGFPLGTALRMAGKGANSIASTTVTEGSISKVLSALIQIDANVNSGSSGSPVFDRHGHAIGVIFEVLGGRIVYAVPGNLIWELRKAAGL